MNDSFESNVEFGDLNKKNQNFHTYREDLNQIQLLPPLKHILLIPISVLKKSHIHRRRPLLSIRPPNLKLHLLELPSRRPVHNMMDPGPNKHLPVPGRAVSRHAIEVDRQRSLQYLEGFPLRKVEVCWGFLARCRQLLVDARGEEELAAI